MKNLDLASPILENKHVRNFAKRVLNVISRNLGYEDNGESVYFTQTVENYSGSCTLKFDVETDEEREGCIYKVTATVRLPLDTEWQNEAVRSLLYIEENRFDDTEDDEKYSDPSDEFVNDTDDDGDQDCYGYFEQERVYRFTIPTNGREAVATSAMYYNFLDEDEEGVDTVVAYHPGVIRDDVDFAQLEAILKDGATYMDVSVHETDFTHMNITDLDLVLDLLKSANLIGRNTVALSKHLRD